MRYLPARELTECPHCGATHSGVIVQNDDGTGTTVIENTDRCNDDNCTADLCSECEQFECDECGLTHCLKHRIEVCGIAMCPVCCKRLADEGGAEYAEALADLKLSGAEAARHEVAA